MALTDHYNKTLSSELGHMRKVLRLTRAQLAEMVGRSEAVVATYLAGRVSIPISVVEKIHAQVDPAHIGLHLKQAYSKNQIMGFAPHASAAAVLTHTWEGR